MRRRLALGLVCAAVLLAHLGLGGVVADDMARIADGTGSTALQRMDVAFVHDLAPTAPAAVPPPAARPRVAAARPGRADARAPAPAEPPASAPAQTVADTPVEPPADALASLAAAQTPAAPPSAPLSTAEAAPLPDAATASAAQAAPLEDLAASGAEPGFAWPPSTRLSYDLKGYYRGDMEGVAQVEWIRQGPRYQVHLDLRIGPAFAPLATRRMSSEGALSERGLQPRLYEETTNVPLRDARQQVIRFEDDRIVLPRGRGAAPLPADWPGVQDAASQFAQFTWLFTTQPQRLVAGGVVEMPLALPRSVERWAYDIVGEETVHTPAGPVQAWHVKPRRETRPGGDLTVALWVAPTLQYLPVRILIRQDADTYMDLTLSRLPQQAAR